MPIKRHVREALRTSAHSGKKERRKKKKKDESEDEDKDKDDEKKKKKGKEPEPEPKGKDKGKGREKAKPKPKPKDNSEESDEDDAPPHPIYGKIKHQPLKVDVMIRSRPDRVFVVKKLAPPRPAPQDPKNQDVSARLVSEAV